MKVYNTGHLIRIEIDEKTAGIKFYFRDGDNINLLDSETKVYRGLTIDEKERLNAIIKPE